MILQPRKRPLRKIVWSARCAHCGWREAATDYSDAQFKRSEHHCDKEPK